MYNCHMAEIDYDDLARQLRVFFGKNRTQKAVKHVVRTTLYDAGITTVQADDDTELAHLCTMLGMISAGLRQRKTRLGL